MKSSSKTMRVLFVILLILFYLGCSKIEWPPETGYVIEPKHRPSKAYEGEKATHIAKVNFNKDGKMQFVIPAGHIIKVRNGGFFRYFPRCNNKILRRITCKSTSSRL